MRMQSQSVNQLGREGRKYLDMQKERRHGTPLMQEYTTLSFWQILSGPASYKIYAGSIICGNTILNVATTTLTLTGSVAYVYAYAKMDLSSAGVNFMALDPLTVPFDGTEYRWRLAKLEAVSAGHYTRTRHYWFGGDLTSYAPLGK